MGPGIDPHLYRASAGDVDRLARAELIVHNGFGLEGQLGAVLDRLGSRVPTLALAEAAAAAGAEAGLLEGEDAYAGRVDPHLWLDAELWSNAAGAAADALVELRPACGDDVRARAAAFSGRLLALDAWAIASVAGVPEARRTLVTSHDAFRYFGRAYGLAVHGVEGISTESEASIADIRATADLVLATGVPAIFVESTISPRTIEAVLAAARDRGGEVAIGGSLFGDAMGEAGTPEGT
jgi:manganese/zinc/iron transport system substrate-binding protein